MKHANILTGKALEDFDKWFRTERATSNFRYWMLVTMEGSLLNSLIIEWFSTIHYRGKSLFDFCFNLAYEASGTKIYDHAVKTAIGVGINIYNTEINNE